MNCLNAQLNGLVNLSNHEEHAQFQILSGQVAIKLVRYNIQIYSYFPRLRGASRKEQKAAQDL